jgi:HD-GYP domain-containing protein (c-di-GMP phosphodiesterase class II)
VDVWDALRSDRPYRASWPADKVIAHIRERQGQDFDPHIVDIFLKHMKDNG